VGSSQATIREKSAISIQRRSGQDFVVRICRLESPPGSEAVRSGESPGRPITPNSIIGRIGGCSAGHVSERELSARDAESTY
jgi:hypothetical protein